MSGLASRSRGITAQQENEQRGLEWKILKVEYFIPRHA